VKTPQPCRERKEYDYNLGENVLGIRQNDRGIYLRRKEKRGRQKKREFEEDQEQHAAFAKESA